MIAAVYAAPPVASTVLQAVIGILPFAEKHNPVQTALGSPLNTRATAFGLRGNPSFPRRQ